MPADVTCRRWTMLAVRLAAGFITTTAGVISRPGYGEL
jgi:hypothetical protein